MDFVNQNVQWQGQPPDVGVLYNPGATWAPTSWVRDAEAQTLSMHEVVREFLMNMVMDGLKRKGLPLMACPHTNELQLENVISGIIDSHSTMCSKTTQQEDSYEDWAGDIPLQDVDDDDDYQENKDEETQQASRIVAQLIEYANSPHDPSMSIGEKTRKPVQQPENVFSGKKTVAGKRPAITVNEDSGEPSKRHRSAPGTSYKCSKCDKEFYLRKDLMRHESKHSLDRPFKCDKCDYRAKTKHQRSKHYRMIHENKYPHYCKICGKGCHTSSSLNQHENSHLKNEDKPFRCKHCNKGHISQSSLDIHVRHHEDDKKIKCHMCEAKFAIAKTYKRHFKSVHKGFISGNSNKCLVCDLEMVERHLLMEHMKENHRDVGESCDDCGMKFSSDKTLEAHLISQHGKLAPTDTTTCKIKDQLRQISNPSATQDTLVPGNTSGKKVTQSCNESVVVQEKVKTAKSQDYQSKNITPGKKVAQSHKSVVLPCVPKKVSKPHSTCKSKATKILEKDLGKTAISGMHAMQTAKSPECQLKTNTTVQKIAQSQKSVGLPEKVSKPCNISTANTILEKDLIKTNISGMYSVQTSKSHDSQSKSTDKPVGNASAKKVYVIYTNTPDKVAGMLLKGQHNISKKAPMHVNVPVSAESSLSGDENVNANQVRVPNVKDVPNPRVYTFQSNTHTTSATKMPPSGVSSTAPAKFIVIKTGLPSSSVPSQTLHPQRVETLKSSLVEQTKETGQPEGNHSQVIETIGKDGKAVEACEISSKDGKAVTERESPSKDGKAMTEKENPSIKMEKL